MTYIEIFLLALGLSVDSFAVSLSGGVCSKQLSKAKMAKIAAIFALFQGGFTIIGWLLGVGINTMISQIDHWVAFILLSYIGGKMIYESLFSKADNKSINLLHTKTLLLSAIATSIDALAVGISFAMLSLSSLKLTVSFATVALITFFASMSGLMSGCKVGPLFGKRSEVFGGIILIVIGIKILIEHLFFQ